MKKKFVVKIKEVLEREVIVFADNEFDAKEEIESKYLNSEIILDSNDFVYVEYDSSQIE